MIRQSLFFCALLIAVLAGTAGCKSSGGKKTATATARASLTAPAKTPGPAVTPVDAIRGIDLESVAAVRAIEFKSTGAKVDRSLVAYADLTGDGIEEAVVPFAAGGAPNVVGFVVLKLDAGDASNVKAILSEDPTPGPHGLALRVEGGKLIETKGAPGPDDPECCPSMLQVTTYAWNGAALIVESKNTIVNPSGGVKGTPGAGSPSPSGTQ